jgi:uncharacterized membrane protein YkoI
MKRALVALGAVAVLAAGGAALAGATGGNDESPGHDDGSGTPITGSALDRAKAVALQHTGGGKATDSEIRDEEGYYEVEVQKPDGSQVDVHLDRNFNVLNEQGDGGPGN